MIIDFDSKNNGGGSKPPVVEALSVTTNGTYNAPSGVYGYNPVEVNVPQSGGLFPFKYLDTSAVSMKTTLTEFDKTGMDLTFTPVAGMFKNCSKIKKIDLSNVVFPYTNGSNKYVIDFNETFYNCTSLEEVDLSGIFQTDNTYFFTNGFYNCISLSVIKLDGLKVITKGVHWGLQTCPKLSIETMLSIFDKLEKTFNNYECQLGDVNLAKLTDEQKKIATGKGWVLV